MWKDGNTGRRGGIPRAERGAVDEEGVVDGLLVTSRKPADLPAFNREMIALFARATQPASM